MIFWTDPLMHDTRLPLAQLVKNQESSIVPSLLSIQEEQLDSGRSLDWAASLEVITTRPISDSGESCLFLRSRQNTQSTQNTRSVPSSQRSQSSQINLSIQRSQRNNGDQPKTTLYRCSVVSLPSTGKYAAISYPWSATPFEIPKSSEYEVETRGANYDQSDPATAFTPCKVRSAVMDRVMVFVKHHRLNAFWIDQECVDQDNPHEKQAAVQSMDLVYSLSDHPVGFLTVPVQTQSEMEMLANIVKGAYVSKTPAPSQRDRYNPELDELVDPELASAVLSLLRRITSDPWFNRAWTFQEEYLSKGEKMKLLIPHLQGLRKQHLRKELGSIRNADEIEVAAVAFRRQLTTFCIAYLRKEFDAETVEDKNGTKHKTKNTNKNKRRRKADGSTIWQIDRDVCREILLRAARYSTLSKYGHLVGLHGPGRAMSSTIFADIGRRSIACPSDILAITANCCGYGVRLNAMRLERAKQSLSLCILGLFLLNGEIIKNDTDDTAAAATSVIGLSGTNSPQQKLSPSIYDYLKFISFDKFDPPVDVGELSFLKKCRFPQPMLTGAGVRVTGHLWVIDQILDVSGGVINYRKRLLVGGDGMADGKGEDDKPFFDDQAQSVLRQLISVMTRHGDETEKLRNRLSEMLEYDLEPPSRGSYHEEEETDTTTPFPHIQASMAKKIVKSMIQGKRIGLGRLDIPPATTGDDAHRHTRHQKLAVFVLEDDDFDDPPNEQETKDKNPIDCQKILEPLKVFTSYRPATGRLRGLKMDTRVSQRDFSRAKELLRDDERLVSLIVAVDGTSNDETTTPPSPSPEISLPPARNTRARAKARTTARTRARTSISVGKTKDTNASTPSQPSNTNHCRLRTKQWINGLWYPEGVPERDVVFPWPSSINSTGLDITL